MIASVEWSPGKWWRRVNMPNSLSKMSQYLTKLAKADAKRIAVAYLKYQYPVIAISDYLFKLDPGEKWHATETVTGLYEPARGDFGYDCEDYARAVAALGLLHNYPARVKLIRKSPRLVHAVADVAGEEVDVSGYLEVGLHAKRLKQQSERFPFLTW